MAVLQVMTVIFGDRIFLFLWLTVSALMCWSRFHWNFRFLMLRIAILHCIGELKVIVFEYNNQYKFFKFVIDPSKMIFFDAKQWKICPNKKELNIEKTATQYNSSFADINIRIH